MVRIMYSWQTGRDGLTVKLAYQDTGLVAIL